MMVGKFVDLGFEIIPKLDSYFLMTVILIKFPSSEKPYILFKSMDYKNPIMSY